MSERLLTTINKSWPTEPGKAFLQNPVDFSFFGARSALIDECAVGYVLDKGELEEIVPQNWQAYVKSHDNDFARVISFLEMLRQLLGKLSARAQEISVIVDCSNDRVIEVTEQLHNQDEEFVRRTIINTQKFMKANLDPRDKEFEVEEDSRLLDSSNVTYLSYHITAMNWCVAETLIENKNL